MVTGPRKARAPFGAGRRWPAALLLAALAAVAVSGAAAQDARVTATADTNTILIGDQVRVTVSVDHPAGTVVRNLGPSDSLGGLEIVRIDSVAGAGPSGPGPFTRVYTITAFDTGTRILPPFLAWYGAASDTAVRSVSGHPVVIVVHGVDVDTAAAIRGIKPPLGVPITLAEVLPYVIAAALAALLAWLVYYVWKKWKRGEKIIPAAPARPPDELALEALRSIEAERLWQRGLAKEYHSALSDVLRTYIERRFAMPAMESTSDEILSSAPVASLPPDAAGALRDVLVRSDLAKFAKFVPPPEQNERSFRHSVGFVELTRRAAAPAQRGVPDAQSSPPVAAPASAVPDGAAEGGPPR